MFTAKRSKVNSDNIGCPRLNTSDLRDCSVDYKFPDFFPSFGFFFFLFADLLHETSTRLLRSATLILHSGTLPTIGTLTNLSMEAQDREQPFNGPPPPVCPITHYFEEAYNAMGFDDTDYTQDIEMDDSSITQQIESPNRDIPVIVVDSPKFNHGAEDLQTPNYPSTSQTGYDPLSQGPVTPTASGDIPRRLADIPAAGCLLGQTALRSRRWISNSARPKGQVRFHSTGMDYQESPGDEWLPAVYHFNLRRQYILYSFSIDQYTHPDPQGNGGPIDITTYHPDQKTWGPAWQDRPPILKRFVRGEYLGSSYEPAVLTDRGRVVIDQDNHAVKAWSELPLCISSKVPGWKMEAWRRINPKISIFDFLARMVRTDKPLDSERNKLSMRMQRFRLKGACITWVEREGCEAIRDYMTNLIGPACVAANSIEAFGRDLTEAEMAQATRANKGRFPQRSRHKGKFEPPALDGGSKQQPLVVESDEEEAEEIMTDEDDEYIQVPVPTQRLPLAAPPGPTQVNANGSEVISERPQRVVPRGFLDPRSQNSYRRPAWEIAEPSTAHTIPRGPVFQKEDLRTHHRRGRESIRADPRFKEPCNEAEALSIQRALRFTRDEFVLHYSEEAPLTDIRQSYWLQLQELRVAFVQRWSFRGPLPLLASIEDWGDTVMDWRPPGQYCSHQNLR